MSLVVEPGACDIVVDPGALPGYEFKETEAPTAGGFSVTFAGDTIPQLGGFEYVVCVEN